MLKFFRRLRQKMLNKNQFRKYLIYATGEIALIMIGILLALYINNLNVKHQYQNQIDNNVLRLRSELEENISASRKTIERLRYKDSLIHLVMTDSVKEIDYYNNLDLPFLIVNNHQISLSDKAYQNLLLVNVSDHKYKEQLLSDVKDLYSLTEPVTTTSKRMSEFIFDTGIPFLSKQIKSFGDITYSRTIKKEAIAYYLNSEEYKSYVSQYAIFAIRNQLDANRNFYKNALRVYKQICEAYTLPNTNQIDFNSEMIDRYTGKFAHHRLRDPLQIKFENDSLFIEQRNATSSLVPLDEKHFFVDGEGQIIYFISFFRRVDGTPKQQMKLQLMADQYVLDKVE